MADYPPADLCAPLGGSGTFGAVNPPKRRGRSPWAWWCSRIFNQRQSEQSAADWKSKAIPPRASVSSPIRGDGQQTKAQNFGGRFPPKVRAFVTLFLGGIRPREAVPRFGDHLPTALHRHGSRWERELGENDSGRVPPRVVLRHFSSLFTAHRRFCRWATWNRVEGPGFSNRPLPASPPFASIAALSTLRSLHWEEGSPLRPSPPFVTHLRGGHRRFPRFDNQGRTGSPAPPSAAGADGNGNWGRGLGETRSPSPLLPSSIASRSSSTFPPMSCLGIRVGQPEFWNPILPAPRQFTSIGGFSTFWSF